MTTQLSPVEGLMLRAAMYQFLALGYAYPDAGQRHQLLEAAADLSPWVELIGQEWPDRLVQLCESLHSESAEADFNRLFSGAMACAPYETSYERDIFRKQNALADMSGFYRAFGFQLADGTRWQPDHVGVQLEYCSILLQRTAQAVEKNWDEQATVCVDALRKFLEEHLGRWSNAFSGDLEREAGTPFYRHLAWLTRAWTEAEMGALDVQPDRYTSRYIAPDDAELPMCGGCTGCGPDGATVPCPLPNPPPGKVSL